MPVPTATASATALAAAELEGLPGSGGGEWLVPHAALATANVARITMIDFPERPISFSRWLLLETAPSDQHPTTRAGFLLGMGTVSTEKSDASSAAAGRLLETTHRIVTAAAIHWLAHRFDLGDSPIALHAEHGMSLMYR